MSNPSIAAERLRKLPGWADRDATLTALTGGYHGRSFRVDSDGERYVLRIAHAVPSARGGGLLTEQRVHALAAEQGIAPRVHQADAEHGLLLTDYIDGETWTPQSLGERGNLRDLADLLRELHALPCCGVPYDAQAAADCYFAELRAAGQSTPLAETCRRIVAEREPPANPACCHNDVVAENVLRGESLMLIDFEYAGDNDPLYDLACVIGWHHLDAANADYLLEAYTDGASAEDRERLAAERRVFDAMQWLWLAYRRVLHRTSADDAQLERVAARLA